MTNKLKISLESKLIDALKQMDATGAGGLFVVDDNDFLLGIITDGDVRRALLKNATMAAPLSEIMNPKFHFLRDDQPIEDGIRYLRQINRRQLPVINSVGRLMDVILLDDIEFTKFDNPVVFMVGGLGKRLMPLTENVPKPMLTISGKPMMEIMVERFANQGFSNFHFCTNYRSDYIQSHFSSGEKWGVKINYVREDKKLGTAGALSLLKDQLTTPFIVINGDILSTINFGKLISHHEQHTSPITMCVAPYEIEIPYGVVEMEGQLVQKIVEKPVRSFSINTGIYVVSPRALQLLNHNEYLDMPNLIHSVIQNGDSVNSFPIHEYWKDIGNVADYERANVEFGSKF